LVVVKDMGSKIAARAIANSRRPQHWRGLRDFGKVVRMEQLYVVTLKLHETRAAACLARRGGRLEQVELLGLLREHARQLTTARSARDWPEVGAWCGSAGAVVWSDERFSLLAIDSWLLLRR